MGQSSSTEQASSSSSEQREAESLTASTGALPNLQKAFSLLSDPQTQTIPLNSLQKCFELKYDNLTDVGTSVPKELPLLMTQLGGSIVDLFFVGEKGGVNWVEFLKGHIKCCGRAVASTLFNNLFRVFELAVEKAGLPAKLQFEAYDNDFKMNGSLLARDVLMVLLLCWVMSWDSRKLKSSYMKGDPCFPDLDHLVLSAVELCAEGGDKLDFWDCDISSLDAELPAAKIHMWALNTLPHLADCLSQFVQSRLCYLQTNEDKSEGSCSSANDSCPSAVSNHRLLTGGRAWTISLTLRGRVSEEIARVCFPCDGDEPEKNLLYRSSLHGKGMNRLWSNVDGYNGPLLFLITASADDNVRKWIIGALTHQGLENKETFYGTSGALYAMVPAFHVYLSSGKEKNIVYSHLHQTVRMYEPHPKPVGIGFGGSSGNERIFMDEDFTKITFRHHAVDKSYQHGPLFPNQGFLPLEASVLEVEVWGLGGERVKEVQESYQRREELFTEQRRKVDLKTFANWEDSPEKMMMDIMSNPNTVRREER